MAAGMAGRRAKKREERRKKTRLMLKRAAGLGPWVSPSWPG